MELSPIDILDWDIQLLMGEYVLKAYLKKKLDDEQKSRDYHIVRCKDNILLRPVNKIISKSKKITVEFKDKSNLFKKEIKSWWYGDINYFSNVYNEKSICIKFLDYRFKPSFRIMIYNKMS